MPPFEISDFRGGLDTRRLAVSGQVGTAVVLDNCHVSRGGEIEKRRAFVRKYALPDGTHGLASVRGSLVVFGSAERPAGLHSAIGYQRLQHPSGLALKRVLDHDTFGGKLYVSASFEDGSILHFYDGALVPFWQSYGGVSQIASNEQTAAYLASIIDQSEAYVASSAQAVVRVRASVAGTPFTWSASVLGGTTQAITPTLAQGNVAGLPAVAATASIRIAASGGTITDVLAGGVSIIDAPVEHSGDAAATAAALASAITSATSSPEYTATATGDTVLVRAPASAGASANGTALSVSFSGANPVAEALTFAGGQSAVAAVAQEVAFEITGDYAENAVYQILLGGVAFSKYGNLAGRGMAVKSHRNKLHTCVQEYLYFSDLADPTKWDAGQDNLGAGFLRLTDYASGAEALTAMGVYNDQLAVFGANTTYLLTMDPDPEKVVVNQILENTGTAYSGSVQSVGQDVYYLDASGIRSLRQRQYTDSPGVSDVGTQIDELVATTLRGLTQAQRLDVHSVIEPEGGRYWLLAGTTAFVLSAYPSAGISAWSTYTLPAQVEAVALANRRVWLRCGDGLYLYGGDSGDVYDDCRVVVQLPFLDLGMPSVRKRYKAFDAAVLGAWDVEVLLRPTNANVRERVGTITESTYQARTLGLNCTSTHIGVRLVSQAQGPARISKIVLDATAQTQA